MNHTGGGPCAAHTGGAPCAAHTGADINQTWHSGKLMNGEVDPLLKATSGDFHVEVKTDQQNTASTLKRQQFERDTEM